MQNYLFMLMHLVLPLAGQPDYNDKLLQFTGRILGIQIEYWKFRHGKL